MDVDALSPTQRQALDQLQVLTDGGDQEVAIGVLDSCGWDVQVSVLPVHCISVSPSQGFEKVFSAYICIIERHPFCLTLYGHRSRTA